MRIVVKLGTSTLAHSTGHLNIRRVEELCKVMSDIKNAGNEIIVVSSGAIGMGAGKLALSGKPQDIPTKQAAAAVGQCELMYTYDKLFSEYNHTVAQLLMTGADLENEEEVWKVILSLCQDIGHRLRVHELSAKGVQVAVRGHDLLGSQFQGKLPFKTQLPSEIGATAFRLFRERYKWDSKVRAITVRAIDLVPYNEPDQISMFVDHARLERRERLEDTVEGLRRRFGKHAITYGILMGDLKMPDDGRHIVKMPGLMYQ